MTAARRKGAECEGVACEHALGQQPLRLYEYLWSNANPDDEDSGKQAFSLMLTDTVVFKRQKPVKWFFTSKQERGKILCKTKRFLTTSRVLQEFLVPRWVSNSLPKLDNGKQILATFSYLERSSAFGEMQMIIEHLDKAELEHLLEKRDKPGLSVLQRFIPTQSGYNHTVRSDWSADSCTVQKCISPFLLSDTKISIAQRTATFEVDDPLLRHRDVTDKEVRKSIERINAEMRTHLEAIVGKRMARFVSYFKIGVDHRIYLLWSSMLSFDAGAKGAAKHYSMALSHSLCPSSSSNNEETPQMTNQSLIGCAAQLKVCPNCNRMFPRDEVQYVVTNKSILRQCKRDSVDNAEKMIPTMLNASIQGERYKHVKRSAAYLYQTVQLCSSCARNINVIAKTCSSPSRNNNEDVMHDESTGMSNEDTRLQADQHPPKENKRCSSAKEEEVKKNQKPIVVVHTRALSAGSMRLNFSKKNITNGSNQYRQHFLRVLPRLHAFGPSELAPRDRMRQLALHLKRTYGHPSLRFALSQCNVFPVGSMVPLRALGSVCSTELLMSVALYWAELSQVQESSISPQTIDIDAIDSLLAASLKSSYQTTRSTEDAPSHPRRQKIRPTRFMQATEASCPLIPSDPSTTMCVPKRPDRPHSCIPASFTSRRARLLSLTARKVREPSSSDEMQPADSSGRSKPTVHVIDGIQCRVQMSARNDDDGQCVLHLEVVKLSSADSNQALELTLKTSQIIALLGKTQHLSSQSALLNGILPLLRIENAQLCIPVLQQRQQCAALPGSSSQSSLLLPHPPPCRVPNDNQAHFE
ncbi:hypothetical protein GN958_ATG15103 [Phytophthora infestans]|uniref:Uncharacterized protein n=1 Tax=Phytophthora infestans TaxID=4787 RepID=A0A8S9U464_PHYIN|nr:hypothetical protein GN958_ATG15103 [Phytophthora infestans]